MYSKSLIESHPTMVSTLSDRFFNSLLGWNRGTYWNQYTPRVYQSCKSNCTLGAVIQLILIIQSNK